MTWETFYFGCFLVGFFTSLITFLSGTAHVHIPHLPHFHGHGFSAHGAQGHAPGARGGSRGGPTSWFNFGTLTAFLAWFGGTGYLLTRYSSLWAILALLLASLSGFAGAALVFAFLFKFLLAQEGDLDPADYSMVGVLGRLNGSLRAGGTGEIIFSRDGSRQCAAARSEENQPIPANAEVVVIRYENGIAYVKPWVELTGDDAHAPARQPGPGLSEEVQ